MKNIALIQLQTKMNGEFILFTPFLTHNLHSGKFNTRKNHCNCFFPSEDSKISYALCTSQFTKHKAYYIKNGLLLPLEHYLNNAEQNVINCKML